jgi:hypothetical protein
MQVTERTVKILLCCGFRQTGKAMEQVEDMSRNKYIPRFEYHMIEILYPSVTYLVSPHRRYTIYIYSYTPYSNLEN